MDTFLKYAGVVALIVIAIILALTAFGHKSAFGAVSTNCNSFTTCLSDLYLTTTGGGSGSIQVAGTSLLTGTTTLSSSVSGMVTGGHYTVTATGTPVTLYTNSGTPKICDTHTGYFYVKSTGFSPSLVFTVGTSSAAVPTTNLIASTTVATTTTSYYHPSTNGNSFLLNTGDSIVAEAGNVTNDTLASSTYYGNWSVEFGLWCNNAQI